MVFQDGVDIGHEFVLRLIAPDEAGVASGISPYQLAIFSDLQEN